MNWQPPNLAFDTSEMAFLAGFVDGLDLAERFVLGFLGLRWPDYKFISIIIVL